MRFRSGALAFDRASVRSYDADGRLRLDKSNISKANICEYLGSEIPDFEALKLDPNKRYKLLRHPDELKKAASTFNNLPILSRHVPVSADNHQPDLVVGSTGSDASFDGTFLSASLIFWAREAIDDIESEVKKELSSAYRYSADMTPGCYGGERYDGVMRNIIGNHVALVREGRAGPDVVVGDSKENTDMKHSTRRRARMARDEDPSNAPFFRRVMEFANERLDPEDGNVLLRILQDASDDMTMDTEGPSAPAMSVARAFERLPTNHKHQVLDHISGLLSGGAEDDAGELEQQIADLATKIDPSRLPALLQKIRAATRAGQPDAGAEPAQDGQITKEFAERYPEAVISALRTGDGGMAVGNRSGYSPAKAPGDGTGFYERFPDAANIKQGW